MNEIWTKKYCHNFIWTLNGEGKNERIINKFCLFYAINLGVWECCNFEIHFYSHFPPFIWALQRWSSQSIVVVNFHGNLSLKRQQTPIASFLCCCCKCVSERPHSCSFVFVTFSSTNDEHLRVQQKQQQHIGVNAGVRIKSARSLKKKLVCVRLCLHRRFNFHSCSFVEKSNVKISKGVSEWSYSCWLRARTRANKICFSTNEH